MTMSSDFADVVRDRTEQHSVPGASAGILRDGEQLLATYGVTSVENPLAVDPGTLFQSGSIGKTYTATAMLRLAEQGQVELDAPVRRYVPGLRLADPQVAEQVTIAQLLNHTAGWDGDFSPDTGAGDDALARYVERLAKAAQVSPLGAGVSYNNTSLSLAGRVIEVVTGQTFERAIGELLLRPLELHDTHYFADDVMTRRFVVGHQNRADGRVTVMRPWALSRAGNPAGGMTTTVADLLAWARFHLGDGRAPSGARLLSIELLHRMQEPTVQMHGAALGDFVGISWFLRDLDGVRIVDHGGTTLGQHAELTLVPSQRIAVAILTNSSPNGATLNRDVTGWALAELAGLRPPEPATGTRTAAELAAYVGTFETSAALCQVEPRADGLLVRARTKAETLRELGLDPADVEASEDLPLLLVGDSGDQYVVSAGPAKGLRGYFQRDDTGAVQRLHIGGRLAERVVATATKETQ
jgi:CubicO group peptidase (beta-lactamase class C family)